MVFNNLKLISQLSTSWMMVHLLSSILTIVLSILIMVNPSPSIQRTKT